MSTLSHFTLFLHAECIQTNPPPSPPQLNNSTTAFLNQQRHQSNHHAGKGSHGLLEHSPVRRSARLPGQSGFWPATPHHIIRDRREDASGAAAAAAAAATAPAAATATVYAGDDRSRESLHQRHHTGPIMSGARGSRRSSGGGGGGGGGRGGGGGGGGDKLFSSKRARHSRDGINTVVVSAPSASAAAASAATAAATAASAAASGPASAAAAAATSVSVASAASAASTSTPAPVRKGCQSQGQRQFGNGIAGASGSGNGGGGGGSRRGLLPGDGELRVFYSIEALLDYRMTALRDTASPQRSSSTPIDPLHRSGPLRLTGQGAAAGAVARAASAGASGGGGGGGGGAAPAFVSGRAVGGGGDKSGASVNYAARYREIEREWAAMSRHRQEQLRALGGDGGDALSGERTQHPLDAGRVERKEGEADDEDERDRHHGLAASTESLASMEAAVVERRERESIMRDTLKVLLESRKRVLARQALVRQQKIAQVGWWEWWVCWTWRGSGGGCCLRV